jgi:small subunit ribosomal protein S15
MVVVMPCLQTTAKTLACRRHKTDVGSTEVQIAGCTARIEHLTNHLKQNKRDHATRRGLVAILNRRKKLMKYLFGQDKRTFARCVRELGIRNPIKGAVIREDVDKMSQRAAAEKA